MFSKKNNTSKIDPEQRELIERAQERAKQKKRLYQHLIFFLIGAVVFIVLNVILEYGQDIRPFGIDWFVWAILVWGVILLLHVYNVFVTNKFLGKDWEDRQIEKLVTKQRKRMDELQAKVERGDYTGSGKPGSNPGPEKNPERDPKRNPDRKPKDHPDGNPTPEPSHDKPIDPGSPINT